MTYVNDCLHWYFYMGRQCSQLNHLNSGTLNSAKNTENLDFLKASGLFEIKTLDISMNFY